MAEITLEKHNRRATDTHYATLSSRMDGIENTLHTFIKSTDRQIATLDNEVKDGNRHILDKIDKLTSTQSSFQRTNWSNIATWAGVLVVVMGLVVYQPMQEMRAHVRDHTTDGHPVHVIEQIKTVEETWKAQQRVNERRFTEVDGELDELDDMLQREMRLLDDNIESKLNSLDDVLQREMRQLDEIRDAETKRVADRQSRFQEWKDRVDRWMLTQEAEQAASEERLLGLERDRYTGASYRSGRPLRTETDQDGNITITD